MKKRRVNIDLVPVINVTFLVATRLMLLFKALWMS